MPVSSTKRSAASSAPSAHTSVPSTSTGREAPASSAPMVSSDSSSGASRSRGPTTGRSTDALSKNWSMGTSRKAGPRCDDAASVNASSTAPAISETWCTVRADLVTGDTRGAWSSSCSDPMPHRLSGARPPITTSGEPLNCAWVIALTPLVTPGPAVSTASPGTRVSLPSASAAKTALCSCRTSSSRIGGSACTAASYIGNTWAPERVNSVSTPCAAATATACSPPCPSVEPASVASLMRGRLPGAQLAGAVPGSPSSTSSTPASPASAW
jgi:hypothetical protein